MNSKWLTLGLAGIAGTVVVFLRRAFMFSIVAVTIFAGAAYFKPDYVAYVDKERQAQDVRDLRKIQDEKEQRQERMETLKIQTEADLKKDKEKADAQLRLETLKLQADKIKADAQRAAEKRAQLEIKKALSANSPPATEDRSAYNHPPIPEEKLKTIVREMETPQTPAQPVVVAPMPPVGFQSISIYTPDRAAMLWNGRCGIMGGTNYNVCERNKANAQQACSQYSGERNYECMRYQLSQLTNWAHCAPLQNTVVVAYCMRNQLDH